MNTFVNTLRCLLNFEQLYETHKKQVYNLVLQYVQNTEDAQEITQDVFVKVYHSLSSFKGDSAVSTWICRIAINCSLDFIRTRKRKKRFAFFTSLFHEDSNEIRMDVPTFDHPGVAIESRQETARIFDAVNRLPDSQKTALILHKIEQKSQAEVAEIMKVSPKAVESLIQRAKVNMEKYLSHSEG